MGRLRRVAPGADQGTVGRDQGASRVRDRRLPARAPLGTDRLRVPGRRVASQASRAGRPRAPATSRCRVGGGSGMSTVTDLPANMPRVATREEWLAERTRLLEDEKRMTRERDELNTRRRQL